MNIFKKTLLYAIPTVMLLGGAIGCSDFIDIEPENEVAEESVDFSNTSNMYQPVIGVYAQVRSYAMHWVNALLMFTRDGDLWSGRYDDQGSAATFSREFVYDNSYWGLNQVWINWYTIIRAANSALESLDSYAEYLTEGSSDYSDYESYSGEVRTLRAWSYYNLVTNFGPVPLYKDNTQTDFHRSTVEAVYDYILEDLDYAMDKMYYMRPNQMTHEGAVSGYTAEMLAAKVHLILGNYDEVEELTDDIINNGGFSLYDDYYQLFKIPGKLCDESLFECQVTDYGNGSGDSINVDQWFNFMGPFSLTDGTNSLGGWGFLGYESEFVEWAEDRGETVRATTSFLKAGSTTEEGWTVGDAQGTSTDCWNGKGYLPYEQMTLGRTTYGFNNNVRVLRYSEVLLMNSEAKIRLGKSGDSSYNLVRERAGMSTQTGVTVDNVLDERRMELCCEWGCRYTDLIRTGLASSVLGSKGWTEDKTYWPVPSTQLENLPELAEDPIE